MGARLLKSLPAVGPQLQECLSPISLIVTRPQTNHSIPRKSSLRSPGWYLQRFTYPLFLVFSFLILPKVALWSSLRIIWWEEYLNFNCLIFSKEVPEKVSFCSDHIQTTQDTLKVKHGKTVCYNQATKPILTKIGKYLPDVRLKKKGWGVCL